MHQRPLAPRLSVASSLAILSGLLLICLFARPPFAGAGPAGEETGPTPVCYGDCNEDGQVTVDDVLKMVGIILSRLPLASCPVLTKPPSISDVIVAVNVALGGCPSSPSPTHTFIPTETPIPTPPPVLFILGEGSQIVYSAPSTLPVEEPLSGWLALSFRENVPEFSVYDVTGFDFHSPEFSVTPQNPSHAGDAYVDRECPTLAIIALQALINDASVPLSSYARVPGCGYPQNLSAIESFELCNPIGNPQLCEAIRAGTQAGYSLTIVPASN